MLALLTLDHRLLTIAGLIERVSITQAACKNVRGSKTITNADKTNQQPRRVFYLKAMEIARLTID
jgi:hypothetical protein